MVFALHWQGDVCRQRPLLISSSLFRGLCLPRKVCVGLAMHVTFGLAMHVTLIPEGSGLRTSPTDICTHDCMDVTFGLAMHVTFGLAMHVTLIPEGSGLRTSPTDTCTHDCMDACLYLHGGACQDSSERLGG